MREKINFQPNQPLTLTIDEEPRETTGNKNDTQFMYIWNGEKISWLDIPAHTAVQEALDLAEGEGFAGRTITICKRTGRQGNRQVVEWQVSHHRSQADVPAHASRQQQQQPTQALSRQQPQSAPAARQQQTQAPTLGYSILTTASIFKEALTASYAVWLDIQATANRDGMSLNFDAGEVQATAEAIFRQVTETSKQRNQERAA